MDALSTVGAGATSLAGSIGGAAIGFSSTFSVAATGPVAAGRASVGAGRVASWGVASAMLSLSRSSSKAKLVDNEWFRGGAVDGLDIRNSDGLSNSRLMVVG